MEAREGGAASAHNAGSIVECPPPWDRHDFGRPAAKPAGKTGPPARLRIAGRTPEVLSCFALARVGGAVPVAFRGRRSARRPFGLCLVCSQTRNARDIRSTPSCCHCRRVAVS
jgi:hypothetical protein